MNDELTEHIIQELGVPAHLLKGEYGVSPLCSIWDGWFQMRQRREIVGVANDSKIRQEFLEKQLHARTA